MFVVADAEDFVGIDINPVKPSEVCMVFDKDVDINYGLVENDDYEALSDALNRIFARLSG